ncbi:hypothetical protein [Streptomyces sp. NBC_00847]|nr:hypothetical protein [Streptomyces sp. NBC_00847]MCX4886082.1 hypothetical protein [Streptomyces sp. NBC_00847]
MNAHDLNLLALGAGLGAYAVLLVWMVLVFWEDIRPRRTPVPVQPKD